MMVHVYLSVQNYWQNVTHALEETARRNMEMGTADIPAPVQLVDVGALGPPRGL